MAFDVQAARDAGYSQAEIDAYLQAKPATEAITPVAPGQEVDPSEPPPPTTTVTPAGQGSMMPAVATAGLGLASAAVPIGIGIGVGKYGGRMLDVARNMMGSPGQVPVTGVPNPAAVNLGGAAPQQIQVPQSAGTRSPAMQNQMQNLRTAPVSTPAPAPAPAPQMQAAKSIVQKLALDKVMQSAGGMLRGGVGPGMALYSGGLNTNEDEELRRRRAMAPTITGQ